MKSRIALALALGCLWAAPAAGQVMNPDARVSLRVEGRTLADVVERLREASGANIVILEGADTTISLDLTDVPWRDALEVAAEMAGCVVEERTAGVLAVDKPPRVTFVFNNAELTEVIDAIAAISGANVVVAPEVAGTLSLRLTDVPWRDALDVAVKTLGYTMVEEDRGILRVVDPVSLQAQMVTQPYQLRYLRPPATYVPVIESEFLAGETKPPTGDVNTDFPIIEALRKALTPGGDLDFVPASNVVIVRDTQQVHGQVQTIIERLDVEPSQVFVDVKFVSTTNTDVFDLGLDYGDLGPAASISGSQIPITLPFELGEGGFEDGIIAAFDDIIPDHDGTVGPFGDPALNPGATTIPNVIFGSLSFTQVAATLRLLQRDTNTEVVQAPKLVALDGHAATIFVGETIRYAEAKTEQGQAGGLSLSVTEAQSSPVEVGFQLLVVPHVIPGTNTLTMEVIPKETSLSGLGESALAPPGFDVFTVGAQGLEGSIALPRKRSSTVVTSMKLTSGQTAVIGGLTTDVEFKEESGIPGLMKIPVLGYLFKHKSSNVERRSLLVFLTPTIVRTAADQEAILQRELEERRQKYGREYAELVYGNGALPTSLAKKIVEDTQAEQAELLTATEESDDSE